jgi:hypothetical protein
MITTKAIGDKGKKSAEMMLSSSLSQGVSLEWQTTWMAVSAV